jgi:hypothetical protein
MFALFSIHIPVGVRKNAEPAGDRAGAVGIGLAQARPSPAAQNDLKSQKLKYFYHSQPDRVPQAPPASPKSGAISPAIPAPRRR